MLNPAKTAAKVSESDLLRQVVKDLYNNDLGTFELRKMWDGHPKIYQVIYNNMDALRLFGIEIKVGKHRSGTREYLILSGVGRKLRLFPSGTVGLG